MISIRFRDLELWAAEGATRARGFAFEGQRLLDSHEIARRFDSLGSERAFVQSLENMNGFFAVVQFSENSCRLAVDHVRSVPLFYSHDTTPLRVSDDCCWIEDDLGTVERQTWADLEFLCLGYVTGNDTRNPRIKQCLPGEAVFLSPGRASRSVRYFRYQHAATPSCRRDFADAFLQVLDEVFQRLLQVAAGRPIVVPLSGGFDSRLVVIMLRRLGYDGTISFSYGRPGNRESRISQSVAHDADIPWEFVPYSNLQWALSYHSADRRRYERYAGTLASLACYQDWPAVGALTRQALVPHDSVYVPGHSADMLAGSRSTIFPAIYSEQNFQGSVADFVRQYHYVLWPGADDPQWAIAMDRLDRQVREMEEAGISSAASVFESWDWENRQAKFIVNSVRTYDFYGQSWWLPFWDRAFVRFWAGVPRELRLGKQWYDAFVDQLYRRTLQAAAPRRSHLARLRARLRTFPALRRIRRALRPQPRACDEYENHPMQWYGIMSRTQFLDLYRPGQNINSFLTADLLNRISLHEPAKRDQTT